jgi:hypothetical protein
MKISTNGAVVLAIAVAASFGVGVLVSGNRVTAAGAVPAQAARSLEDEAMRHEREGLDALKSGDYDHFAELNADDAVFVDAAGVADKATVMKNVRGGFRLTDYTITNVKFAGISPTAALISYEIRETGNSYGHGFSAHVFVSSVWVQRAGKWLCLFSQETAAHEPQPAH